MYQKQLKMEITCYSVPSDCYPRYNYTLKYARPIWKRYRSLYGSLGLNDQFPLPTFGSVKVFHLQKTDSLQTNLFDMGKGLDKVIRTSVKNGEYIDAIEGSKMHGGTVFVANSRVLCSKKHELGLESVIIELLDKTEYQSREIDCKQRHLVSSTEDLPKVIEKGLERRVLQTFYERMNVLEHLLEIKCLCSEEGSDVDGRFKETRSVEKEDGLVRYWKGKLEKIQKHIDEQFGAVSAEFKDSLISTLVNGKLSPDDLSDTEMRKFILFHSPKDFDISDLQDFFRNEKNDVKSVYDLVNQYAPLKENFNKLVLLVNAQKSVAEQLYGEMRGMLYRSSVLPQDMPLFRIDTNKILTQEVANDILQVNGVASVGYRFQTLEIFVDQSLTYEEKQSTESHLKIVLEKRKISKYTLFYAHNKHKLFTAVGASLTIKQSATLGGFATVGPTAELCILIARHFAEQGPSVFIGNIEGDLTPFAHVIPPQNLAAPPMDIALAKVVASRRQECQLQFKNESGICLASQLYIFQNNDDILWLSGLPVHIWGAASRPGYGVIINAAHFIAGSLIPYVRIEDREPSEGAEINRFAVSGDSGSIVCADSMDGNKVHTIAMLTGSSNYTDIDQNPNMKQQYTALRLQLGLAHLQTQHQTDVNLC